MRTERDARNLSDGVYVLLAEPGLPSCEDCKRYVYDPDDGWKVKKWRGKPMERRDDETPCSRCPKSRDEKPNPEAELSEKNWEAFQYWLTARSGLAIHADDLTCENFSLIQFAYERFLRRQGKVVEIGLGVLAKRPI